jgi:hypothetical protein
MAVKRIIAAGLLNRQTGHPSRIQSNHHWIPAFAGMTDNVRVSFSPTAKLILPTQAWAGHPVNHFYKASIVWGGFRLRQGYEGQVRRHAFK